MRLSKFTDYAFRLLIMSANNDRRLTIHEARHTLDIPEGHLKKIIRTLSGAGYLKSVRGRGGGFELARKPTEIRLDAVLRLTETDFDLVECMRADGNCPVYGQCGLVSVFREARAAFIAPFTRSTLADIMVV